MWQKVEVSSEKLKLKEREAQPGAWLPSAQRSSWRGIRRMVRQEAVSRQWAYKADRGRSRWNDGIKS